MWKMLQQKKPGDYVIGTGETHSVTEFIDVAFRYAGLDPKKHIKIDKRYYRPTEVEYLVADVSKAKRELGFEAKIRFNDLVKIMVDADMRAVGLKPVGEGDKALAKKFPKRWWTAD
jgi:GDPmannose 4,6-dehydratase